MLKFEDIERPLKGETIVENLSSDFHLSRELKVLLQCFPPPSYDQYTQLYIASRNMCSFVYPTGHDWTHIARYKGKHPHS